MTDARVVVGITTFDSGRHLSATLRAVRDQDCPGLCILIRDDGSSDETVSTCEAAAAEDPRIRLIRGARRLGWIANYNALLSQVDAEYFCLVPHDDLCAPDYVRSMVALLDARPDAVLAHSAAMKIDADGRELGPWPGTAYMAPRRTRLSRALRYMWWSEREKGWPFHGVVRTAALRATGGLRPTHFAADDLLLFHLSLLGAFAYDPRVLCHKRMHPGSVSAGYGNTHAEWREYLATYHAVIDAAGLPRSERAVLHAATALREARFAASRPAGALRRALRQRDGLTGGRARQRPVKMRAR